MEMDSLSKVTLLTLNSFGCACIIEEHLPLHDVTRLQGDGSSFFYLLGPGDLWVYRLQDGMA